MNPAPWSLRATCQALASGWNAFFHAPCDARVCAAIRWRNRSEVSLVDLRTWTKERLASYKVPGRICTVDELPRNAMGKVLKKEVTKLFEPPAALPGAEKRESP